MKTAPGGKRRRTMAPLIHFEVVPRGQRAQDLVPTIRRCSISFKAAHDSQDRGGMETSSREAGNAISLLFETLRGAQDDNKLADSYMSEDTGYVINNLDLQDQLNMISRRRLDRNHTNIATIGLRDALNKFAHYDEGLVAFRIDSRGAHYIILGGRHGRSRWVSEILVSKLCKNAAAAVKAIV